MSILRFQFARSFGGFEEFIEGRPMKHEHVMVDGLQPEHQRASSLNPLNCRW
jgi:hypothetical protein